MINAYEISFLLQSAYDTYPLILELRCLATIQDLRILRPNIQYCRGIKSQRTVTKWIKNSKPAARVYYLFGKDDVRGDPNLRVSAAGGV
jgi:hypothetical protein